MFSFKRTNGSENSYARKRVNLHLQSNPDSVLDNIGYVPVNGYVISSDEHELITDGLNACTALGFESQGKVFLAHFTMNVESEIPTVLNAIKKEFDIQTLQKSDIKLKVLLGAWEGQTDSLDSILLLLQQMKLLERFVKQVQQYIKLHIDEVAENSSISRKELYQFLAIESIKNKTNVKRISEFLNRIKSGFTNLPDVVLEKQNDIDQCASTRKLADLPEKRLDYKLGTSEVSGESINLITEINIIIEKYYKHLLPGQRTKLFGGDPKHVSEVRNLQSEIETIREKSSSEEALANLENAISPFVTDNPKGGPRLRAALNNIYTQIKDSKTIYHRPYQNNK